MTEICPALKHRLYGSRFVNFLQLTRKNKSAVFDIFGDDVFRPKVYFEEDVITTIRALRSLRLKPGDLLAFTTPKCYESIVVIYAADAMGLKVLFLSDKFDRFRTQQYLTAYEAKACFTCDYFADDAKWLLRESPSLSVIINLERHISHPDYFSSPINSFISYKELMDKARFYGGFVKPTLLRYAFTSREILVAPKSSIGVFDLVFY